MPTLAYNVILQDTKLSHKQRSEFFEFDDKGWKGIHGAVIAEPFQDSLRKDFNAITVLRDGETAQLDYENKIQIVLVCSEKAPVLARIEL